MDYIGTYLIYIVTLWTIYLTIVLYRFKQTKTRIETMASNWAAHMGQESGQARQEKASTKHLASGQQKIMDTVAAQIPGAASILKSSGVSENEAWALITDPNTMKGLKVLMDTFSGVGKLLDKTGEGKKKKAARGTQAAPLIEYKA